MAKAGITPTVPASPRTLLRRLCYDLTGLPPTAEQADAFAADPSEAAYRATVDRLLASPEHAEYWARHWLDLARYADTIGYAFGGQSSKYPYAWTYRDWVVKALHDDLPYDRFVTLQLAADRLEKRDPTLHCAGSLNARQVAKAVGDYRNFLTLPGRARIATAVQPLLLGADIEQVTSGLVH